ncbi:MAG: hypothetical protein O2971_08735, partial [Proteobacteria bacterium]|nr:hypothetical protein [Pseudomonadota bacterium]
VIVKIHWAFSFMGVVPYSLQNSAGWEEGSMSIKQFNGTASPHLLCGWLRHLIRKPSAANVVDTCNVSRYIM